METIELKFLLKLLGFSNYRTSLSKIELNKQTKASEREKICRRLCDRTFVECTYEITHLKISPPGKALLKADLSNLPVTEQELKVLRASEQKNITPGKTNVPVAQRQAVIQGLADKGLIHVETKINQVWLSQQGKEFLRDECNPQGTSLISLNLLHNYVQFLRKAFSISDEKLPQIGHFDKLPSQEEVLQAVVDLDSQLSTDNYLPIFYLRQKLEPPLSREQLDQALYGLQRDNKIELSTLAEPDKFTSKQLQAGISQPRGGLLFFITVN